MLFEPIPPGRYIYGTTLPAIEQLTRRLLARAAVTVTQQVAAYDLEAAMDLVRQDIAGQVQIASQEFLASIGRKRPVTVTVDVPLLARALQPLENLMASATIASILAASAQEAFLGDEFATRMGMGFLLVWEREQPQGGYQWAPLSPTTIMIKLMRGVPPHLAIKPLYETGALLRSMAQPTLEEEGVPGAVRQVGVIVQPAGNRVEVSFQVRWGSSLPYAPQHMTGFVNPWGYRVPARPFIPGYFDLKAYVASARPMGRFRQLVLSRIRASLRAQAVLGRRAIVLGRPLIGPRGGVVRVPRR